MTILFEKVYKTNSHKAYSDINLRVLNEVGIDIALFIIEITPFTLLIPPRTLSQPF